MRVIQKQHAALSEKRFEAVLVYIEVSLPSVILEKKIHIKQ